MMKLLIKNRFGEFSEKKIILADGEGINLTVSLSEAFSKIGTFFLSVKAGQKTKNIFLGKANDNIPVSIPGKWIDGYLGMLEFALIQRSDDGTTTLNDGAYVIEPILIEMMPNGAFCGTSQYQEISEKLSELTTAYNGEKKARADEEKAYSDFLKALSIRDSKRDEKIRIVFEVLKILVQDRYNITLDKLLTDYNISPGGKND